MIAAVAAHHSVVGALITPGLVALMVLPGLVARLRGWGDDA